jgi:hypothetical protein
MEAFDVPTADLIRVLLLLDIVGMGLLAMFYLRRRAMGWSEYLAWGIFAVLIPVFGPFLVIALRPGSRRRE